MFFDHTWDSGGANGIKRWQTLCPKVREGAGPGHNGRPARPGRLVWGAALVVRSSWWGCLAGRTAGRGRRHTPERGRVGFGTCCGIATCVRGRVHGGRPGGRRGHKSARGCGPTSGVAQSTRVGGTRDGAKNFCCVTTRGRNFRLRRRLWQRGGALTAGTLGLGVLGFGRLVLASPGLPAGGLPAAQLAAAFGVLAVPLVPAAWQVLAATALTQADPGPRSSRPSLAAGLGITMRAAHGSVDLPGDSPGGTWERSPRALISTSDRSVIPQFILLSMN
jgi:hypothetical protein